MKKKHADSKLRIVIIIVICSQVYEAPTEQLPEIDQQYQTRILPC